MDDYLWYRENGWEQERIIKENQRILKISYNGIE